jgi:hypothetical protein
MIDNNQTSKKPLNNMVWVDYLISLINKNQTANWKIISIGVRTCNAAKSSDRYYFKYGIQQQ